jgi:hypothetical protein
MTRPDGSLYDACWASAVTVVVDSGELAVPARIWGRSSKALMDSHSGDPEAAVARDDKHRVQSLCVCRGVGEHGNRTGIDSALDPRNVPGPREGPAEGAEKPDPCGAFYLAGRDRAIALRASHSEPSGGIEGSTCG